MKMLGKVSLKSMVCYHFSLWKLCHNLGLMDPRAPFPADLTCRWSWKWLRSSTTARHPVFSRRPEVWKKYLQMVVVNAAIFGGRVWPSQILHENPHKFRHEIPNSDQLIGIENPDLLGSCDWIYLTVRQGLHPAARWGFWASKCVRSLIQDQKGSPFDGFLNLPSIGRGNSAFYHFGNSGNRQWKLAFCRRFHSCFECGQLSVQSSVFFPGDEWGSAPLLLPTGVGSWIFLAAEWHDARGWWHWETYHYRIHFFLTGRGLGEPFSEHFLPPAEGELWMPWGLWLLLRWGPNLRRMFPSRPCRRSRSQPGSERQKKGDKWSTVLGELFQPCFFTRG